MRGSNESKFRYDAAVRLIDLYHKHVAKDAPDQDLAALTQQLFAPGFTDPRP